MDAVYVKNYLSGGELVASVFDCGSGAEHDRALDRARTANKEPRLVEVVAWGKTRRYAAVNHYIFTDRVKVVEVESQALVPGNYAETSFYPLERGLAKLQELDG